MPASSKKQQQFFGVVKAMQSGDIPKKGAAGKVASDMSKKEVDKYAATKHKGLPDHVREDIDIGHIDDEPGMLKADLYQIATYAAELYKLVNELEKAGTEVDFPHWWQSKVVKAKSYMSAAKHYLENELATNPDAMIEHKHTYTRKALVKLIREEVNKIKKQRTKK